VLQFYQQGKLIGAICHGTLVLARTIDSQTGHSILYGHKVTSVPKSLDRLAFLLDSWFVKHGYIMYSCCVADEVRSCLKHPEDFYKGPSVLVPYVVSNGNLITSRWFMGAELFASRFAEVLQQRMHAVSDTM
jgi:putative intracellular protease/amidase